jgi:hypothetical protein
VADELDVRVDDPTKIYQRQVGLCAPSAFLEDLVTDDPVHYARMAHELFELGFTHMVRGAAPRSGGMFLKPDEELRAYPIPVDKSGSDSIIPEADWLMLSSIRQAYDFWGWQHFYKAKPDRGRDLDRRHRQVLQGHGLCTGDQVSERSPLAQAEQCPAREPVRGSGLPRRPHH